MLLCVACRNGVVAAILCVESLREGGISVFQENLRLKRKERGLSQEELASRLHVVRQTISKWEKGMSVPDSEQIIIVGVRNRMSKRGSLYLRHAIWLAASSAVLHNPALRGNSYMASVSHTCRKTVSIICVVMKDNKAYTPRIPNEISA